MRHILFLDIDGVLNIQSNSYVTAMHRDNLLEPHLVARLNYLCEKVQDSDGEECLEIVISSSWRNDMLELEEVLKEAGFKHWKKVIGKTTTSPNLTKRGQQILHWTNEETNRVWFMPDNSYTIHIIDDEMHDIRDFFNTQHLYGTDSSIGITDKIIQDILIKAKPSILA